MEIFTDAGIDAPFTISEPRTFSLFRFGSDATNETSTGCFAEEMSSSSSPESVPMTAVFGLVMGTVTGAGVMEAIAALILVSAIGKVLLQVRKQLKF